MKYETRYEIVQSPPPPRSEPAAVAKTPVTRHASVCDQSFFLEPHLPSTATQVAIINQLPREIWTHLDGDCVRRPQPVRRDGEAPTCRWTLRSRVSPRALLSEFGPRTTLTIASTTAHGGDSRIRYWPYAHGPPSQLPQTTVRQMLT